MICGGILVSAAPGGPWAEEAAVLMEHLPGRVGQLATKCDLRTVWDELEHKIDAVTNELLAEIHEVRTEIHRTARHLTLPLTTMMSVVNGNVFAALKLS